MVRNINGHQEKIDYNIISITKDGVEEPFHKEIKNKVFNIYVGSKDSLLNEGTYTYKIIYKTQDQIGHFEGYDEFYWNVNGTDWDFPIEDIAATLTLPTGATILQNSCYTGIYGSNETNCTAENRGATAILFSAKNLAEKENLTIAVGFKSGVLKEPSAFMKMIRRDWPSLLLVLAFLFLLAFYVINWIKYGKDPQKPVVIPQFNAPNNLSPASVGYIEKEEFEIKQVSANFIDLAVKDFVAIDEVKDDPKKAFFSKVFTLKKRDKNMAGLQEDQKILLQKCFRKDEKLTLAGNYSPNLRDAIEDFELVLKKTNKNFVENNSNTKIIYKALKIILGIFFGFVLVNAIATSNYQILVIAFMLVFFDGAIIFLLIFLWKDKSKFLFFVVLFFVGIFILPVFLIAFRTSDDFTFFESNCFKFLIFSVISLRPFQYFINKPSQESVDMKAEIEGFKMYLGTAEEDQLKFHNPPEMTGEIYEKFLPYAIVFGVEGIWGEKFKDQLEDTLEAANPFAIQEQFAYNFEKSFSGVLAATSTKPPVSNFSSGGSSSSSSSSSSSRSSSSSSYSGGSSSSGSSGSGSSGGGGGGGGGGGW